MPATITTALAHTQVTNAPDSPVQAVDLENHPDKSFVDTLCSELQYDAHIGYEWLCCAPRSSKDIPCATTNLSVIDENLAKEVALCRTAGPLSSTPF